MSCGKPFHEGAETGGDHGVSRADAVAAGGSGLPRTDSRGRLRCINPACSRRPLVRSDAKCKICNSTLHVVDTEKYGKKTVWDYMYVQSSNHTDKEVEPLLPQSNSQHIKLHRVKSSEQMVAVGICEMTQLRSLDMTGSSVKTLPPEIAQLTNLEILVLPSSIKTLPPEIAQLTNLKQIHWTGHDHPNRKLKEIPDVLTQIQSLENLQLPNHSIKDVLGLKRIKGLKRLNLANNTLTDLSTSGIDQLDTLHDLNLEGNPLHETDGLDGLSALKELRMLNVYQCGLKNLGHEVGALEKLEQLNVGRNKMGHLPPEISNLKQLKKLTANQCRLYSFPKIETLTNLEHINLKRNAIPHLPHGIGDLNKLQTLNLSNNRLQMLPNSFPQLSSLQHFEASYNRLEEIPEETLSIPNLKTIHLDRNHLSEIPNGVEQSGAELIDLTQNEIPLDEFVITETHTGTTLRLLYNPLVKTRDEQGRVTDIQLSEEERIEVDTERYYAHKLRGELENKGVTPEGVSNTIVDKIKKSKQRIQIGGPTDVGAYLHVLIDMYSHPNTFPEYDESLPKPDSPSFFSGFL